MLTWRQSLGNSQLPFKMQQQSALLKQLCDLSSFFHPCKDTAGLVPVSGLWMHPVILDCFPYLPPPMIFSRHWEAVGAGRIIHPFCYPQHTKGTSVPSTGWVFNTRSPVVQESHRQGGDRQRAIAWAEKGSIWVLLPNPLLPVF